MGTDIREETARLLSQGKPASQVRLELEAKGFLTEDIGTVLSTTEQGPMDDRTRGEQRNARLLGTREFFDRIGYGGAPPQFINILLWLSQQANPFILLIIGLLNGLRTIISVALSSILQEYAKLNRVNKNTIAAGGIVFGFSFLLMSFGLLLGNTVGLVLFSVAFIMGGMAIVAYGDLYQKFVNETIRKERLGGFLRGIAHWGIVVTAISLVLAGYLLDIFPMSGTPLDIPLFGKVYHLTLYGYLLSFEITAFAFIIAGYVSSLVSDTREQRSYVFWRFVREHVRIIGSKARALAHNKYATTLLLAVIVSGIIQIIITAYSGIAIYQYLQEQYTMPFFILAIVYATAIVASFLGPFFTDWLQRSTGLTPMLVFGALLTAILPLVLAFNPHLLAIAAALCLYVIGGAITGFAQGLLVRKLLDEETRRSYYQAQSYIIIIPYLLLIPVVAILANLMPLRVMFIVAAGGIVFVVMPIYFLLVTMSQKLRL